MPTGLLEELIACVGPNSCGLWHISPGFNPAEITSEPAESWALSTRRRGGVQEVVE